MSEEILAKAEQIAEEKGMDAAAQFLESNTTESTQESTAEPATEAESAPVVDPVEPEADTSTTEQTPAEGEKVEIPVREQVEHLSDDQFDGLMEKIMEQDADASIPGWMWKRFKQSKKKIEEKGSKLDETLGNLTSVLQNFQQPTTPQAAPETETPASFDKEAYADALTYEPEKAAGMVDDNVKQMQLQNQQLQEQMAIMQLQSQMGAVESQARMRDNTYDAKKSKYVELKANNIRAMYPNATDAQINAEANNQVNNESYALLAQGQDPTVALDVYMKNIGMSVSDSPKSKKEVNIDAIAKSITKHETLGGTAPAAASGTDDITVDKLADMTQKQMIDFGERLAAKANKANKKGIQIGWNQALDQFIQSKMG